MPYEGYQEAPPALELEKSYCPIEVPPLSNDLEKANQQLPELCANIT
jgi:hypothetical protein